MKYKRRISSIMLILIISILCSCNSKNTTNTNYDYSDKNIQKAQFYLDYEAAIADFKKYDDDYKITSNMEGYGIFGGSDIIGLNGEKVKEEFNGSSILCVDKDKDIYTIESNGSEISFDDIKSIPEQRESVNELHQFYVKNGYVFKETFNKRNMTYNSSNFECDNDIISFCKSDFYLLIDHYPLQICNAFEDFYSQDFSNISFTKKGNSFNIIIDAGSNYKDHPYYGTQTYVNYKNIRLNVLADCIEYVAYNKRLFDVQDKVYMEYEWTITTKIEMFDIKLQYEDTSNYVLEDN